ncbi:hypothetical protein [Ramlibacter montanisoli]|jgi:hypothetical protein|uniref:Uncharacterized protein n=1 Tax=Ramlibacter montanisoli TaxID=2732512 RepID=A0A849KCB4_9BURK|nr:hypothetical protein [Ramlibacter montanisoli]NNU42635.1 hypothetical protein [Ramlibacter montanisoli]
MTLQPYVQVDDTPFSVSSADIERHRGKPWRAGRNGVGLNELDYGEVIFRFQDCGRLEEITLQAKVVKLGNVAVPFEALAGFIRGQDPQAFDRAGFLVSPAFGVAFDPAEPFWVTALARHCIPEWEKL